MAQAYRVVAKDKKGDTHGFFVTSSGKWYWVDKGAYRTGAGMVGLPTKHMSLKDAKKQGAKMYKRGTKHTIRSIEQMKQLARGSNVQLQEDIDRENEERARREEEERARREEEEPPLTPEEHAEEIIEETIEAIVETMPEPPIPYDEANPWAFDELLARASAEEEYVPYYSELLEDFLAEQETIRSRGSEDLERTTDDITKALEDYMEASGIRLQRNLEDFEEYGDTIEERRARLAQEKERGLEEYRITQERNEETRDAFLQEQRIVEGRLTEDERKALEDQGVDVDRILKLKEQYEAKQIEAKGRIGEDLEYWLESMGLAGSREAEDLRRTLTTLEADKGSYMSREERAWKEAVEQTNEGFAGRGLFLSGLRGDTLGKMGVERSQMVGDYMRGYQETVDTANISTGRALQDIARQRERAGVEYTRESDDITRAIEEYGQKAGWSLEDIEMATQDIQQEATRRREDIARTEQEYQRRHEYGQSDVLRQREDMLRKAGYSEEDIARDLEQYSRQFGHGQEDIARQERLQQEAAARGISEGTEAYQRLEEDLVRQGAITERDIGREQEAAILGGVGQRRGEYQEEYERGREQYYLSKMFPDIYGEYEPTPIEQQGPTPPGEKGMPSTPSYPGIPEGMIPDDGGRSYYDPKLHQWYLTETGEPVATIPEKRPPGMPGDGDRRLVPEHPGFERPGTSFPPGTGRVRPPEGREGAPIISSPPGGIGTQKPKEDLYEGYSYPPSTGMLEYYG